MLTAHPPTTTTTLTVPHRPAPLTLHMLCPATPPAAIVLFSHGDKLSPADYAPLLQAWARHGLAIVAPDHAGPAHCPLWRARVLDMQAAAHHLAAAQPAAAPIRLAGHSFGAHTVSLLLGARPTHVASPTLALPQADAGVLLTPPGDGSPESLSPDWRGRAYLLLDIAGRRPCLILAGGRDASPITSPLWRWPARPLPPGPAACAPPRAVLALAPAGDHYLGGIATGRGTADPALFAAIAATTAAYLQQGPAWAPPPSHHLIFATPIS